MSGVASNASDPASVAAAKERIVRLEPLRRHLGQASNVLVTLNSAINFVVYCMFSRNFRALLVRRFWPSRAGAGRGRCGRAAAAGSCCCCGAGRVRRRSEGDNSSKRSTTTNHYSEARTNATSVVQQMDSLQHMACLQQMACAGHFPLQSISNGGGGSKQNGNCVLLM